MGRLSHGGDLLDELAAVCVKERATLGRIEAIGAVRKARLGFYNQTTRQYEFFEINEPLEITALVGNVSLRDGKPVVHAHVTLADRRGGAYGGHLVQGVIVFACEFVLDIFDGAEFKRGHDDQTGLPLWEM